MIAMLGVLLVVGAVAAIGYLKRDDLLSALEDKPPVVIHEGADSPEEPSQPKQPAKEPPASPKQIAAREPANQPPPNQFTANLPAIPEQAPPKRVRPRATNPVTLKPKTPRAVASISIKPQTPEEKAAVGQSLAAAREALAVRNPARFEEQLNLATARRFQLREHGGHRPHAHASRHAQRILACRAREREGAEVGG